MLSTASASSPAGSSPPGPFLKGQTGPTCPTPVPLGIFIMEVVCVCSAQV